MITDNIKALIIDMDGVVWKADAPIGDLAATFNSIRERGLKFVFATNNSTKTSEQYVARLKEFGVEKLLREGVAFFVIRRDGVPAPG